MSNNRELVTHKNKDKKDKSHVFWDTQPVPKLNAEIVESGPIETKTLDDVRKEPLNLPAAFEWVEIEINNKTELEGVYKLLNENYVEDDDNMFRFDYSESFLRWALQPPGYFKEWHIGVQVKESKQLVAFISAIPATVNVDHKPIKMVEINFLCVHKKLRSKRLAPVMIKEITRRVNLKDIWQASYTAGIVLPKPVAMTTYYHRSLNPKKLIDVGFSQLPPKYSMATMVKLYRVNDFTLPFRPLKKEDVPSLTALLKQYLSKYKLAVEFHEDEVWHWFQNIKEVMTCYVMNGDSANPDKVTDVFSFYNLPSSIMKHPKYDRLLAAFSFYNIATTISMEDLMNHAITIAKQLDYDVFNCLNIFENSKFLQPLKFAVGDGNLQYYLYNYSTQTKEPSDIGLVLL
ncbi:glycylpeptide N-tetradecanoyltransferase [Tieghemostelium lacteum]|uniref:Glycylpeptide N-tetradecanoyltransferase n=1 Tax=Tieghemostelium lacteum TaxID=361077 RepID=A0A151ZBM2_TIELA|nr:glycylpeptide N-tetradecanoyltransferase [Tieghemostelium lacteum]|eukprot:KYQ91338.1 glycylpeptide N-tetradecanoyltransferase [Tieghemostelium lacteum]